MNTSASPGFDPESAYCQNVAELEELGSVFYARDPIRQAIYPQLAGRAPMVVAQ